MATQQKTNVSARRFKMKNIEFKIAVITKGLSYKEVARMSDSSYPTIYKLSSGGSVTTQLRAKAIAAAVGKEVEDIFDEV